MHTLLPPCRLFPFPTTASDSGNVFRTLKLSKHRLEKQIYLLHPQQPCLTLSLHITQLNPSVMLLTVKRAIV